ncbi:MAG: DUF4388 domain-containing protein [Nitriliruptor sp.]|nr:MAG: DUF4388 domain-containing protein [Nitriliruptor sp.]
MRGNTVLEGDLGDFTLPEILQLLSFTKKSGRLRLHGPTTAGCMILADGELRDVSADVARVGVVRRLLGRGHLDVDPIAEVLSNVEELPSDRRLLTQLVERDVLDGDTAADVGRAQMLDQLTELLRWTQGSFRFDVDPEAADGIDLDLGMSTEELLATATQRLSAWDELNERLGAAGQVVALTPPSPPRDVTVPADGWSLLPLVDGRRTIEDLVELAGRGPFDTRQTLAELIDLGIVSLTDAGAAADEGRSEALARIAAIEADHHPGAAVEAAAAFGKGSAEEDGDLPPPPPPAPADAADDRNLDLAGVDATHEASDDMDDAADAQDASRELAALDGDASQEHDDAGSPPRPLVSTVRAERLQTDPNIDEELVSKLIDGVKEL